MHPAVAQSSGSGKGSAGRLERFPPAEGVAELEWRLEPARSGEATLRLGSRLVHSAYDPEREAAALASRIAAEAAAARARLVVLIGHGLGHLPRELASRLERPLLVWDPFPGVTRTLGVGAEPPGPGVVRVESAEAFERALGGLLPRPAPVKVAIHPGYGELARFEARYAARALRRRAASPEPDARRATVSARSLAALERLPYFETVEALRGRLAGQTAVLVSPGPSLAAALPVLARRSGGVLFAALQALAPLARAGARTDFAVAPDPFDRSEALTGCEASFAALLAETMVEPTFLDRFRERCFLFHLRSGQLHDVVWRESGLESIDEPCATVSEIQLHLAHVLGARRFVLVGMDFCPSDARYPVRFQARRASGRAVLTNSHYFHAARYLDHRCRELASAGCEIWRLGDGLALGGVRPIGIEELRSLLAGAPVWVPPHPASGARSRRRQELAREALRQAAEALPRSEPAGSARAGRRWRDFEELGSERAAACARALERLSGKAAQRMPAPPAPVPSERPGAS